MTQHGRKCFPVVALYSYSAIKLGVFDHRGAELVQHVFALIGNLGVDRLPAHWVICDIQDGALRVLVVRIGNRREVYR